jgi:hypothetical protein
MIPSIANGKNKFFYRKECIIAEEDVVRLGACTSCRYLRRKQDIGNCENAISSVKSMGDASRTERRVHEHWRVESGS